MKSKNQKIEVKRIAAKYGYTVSQVESMIQAPHNFIASNLKDLELPRDLTEEEFNKQAKNYNIPAIGKLYSSYVVYKKLNKIK